MNNGIDIDPAAVGVAAGVAINSILLVCSTHGPIGGFFVALCFALVLYYLPVIAVLLLLGINQQATAILRSHDIKVGFLGADKKQFAGKT